MNGVGATWQQGWGPRGCIPHCSAASMLGSFRELLWTQPRGLALRARIPTPSHELNNFQRGPVPAPTDRADLINYSLQSRLPPRPPITHPPPSTRPFFPATWQPCKLQPRLQRLPTISSLGSALPYQNHPVEYLDRGKKVWRWQHDRPLKASRRSFPPGAQVLNDGGFFLFQ